MARYIYSELADQDLEGIAEYSFDNWGIDQTRAYRKSIDNAAKLIANFPSMGRPYISKQTGNVFQRFAVGEHTLFYQPTEDGIFIIRVLHQSMDFDRHLEG